MTTQEKSKRFRIPNVDVLLNELEVRVVHTRQFQRLFYLRQLGLAYLVYPGATHTRGVHSIETLYQANRILESLKERDKENGPAERWNIQEEDCRAIRLAALLHDIGHIPFSHTLEDEHCVLHKHDGPERVNDAFELLYHDLGHLADQEKADLENTKTILIAVSSKVESDKDWRSDIVGDTICADLLAYINADSAWTGIEKRSGHYRIYDYFALADGKWVDGQGKKIKRLCIQLTKNGVLRTDVVSAILDILGMRYTLTERVLFHHAKCVASSMLARAARLCNLDDEDCRCVQEDRDTGKANGKSANSSTRKRSLLRMGDETFLDLLEERASRAEGQIGLRLIERLRSRNFYKRIFKVSTRERDAKNDGAGDSFSELWRDRKNVEETLVNIEDNLGLPRGSLVLWCSDQKAGKKLVRVNVVWESDDCKEAVELRDEKIEKKFPTVYKRVEAVEEQYNDLWCLWVAIDRDYVDAVPQVIQALENRLGVTCDKMFKESHLRKKFKITKERERVERDISETLIPLVHGVIERLVPSSAKDGNDNHYTRDDILRALSEEVKEATPEEPIKKRSKGSSSARQLEILSDGQRDEQQS